MTSNIVWSPAEADSSVEPATAIPAAATFTTLAVPPTSTARPAESGDLDRPLAPPGRPRRATTPAPASGATPAPPPVRPKGRLLAGALLLSIFALIGHFLWEGFLRADGHAVITGRTLRLSAPWAAAVATIHVREGDLVQPGQELVTLTNLDLERQQARLRDDLRLAQARLAAAVSQLRWQSQERADDAQRLVADYYDRLGELLREQALLADLDEKLARRRQARDRSAVTEEELTEVAHRRTGQQARITHLAQAVAELKLRCDAARQSSPEAAAQLEPHVVEIERLQAELVRHAEELARGRLRSPVGGRVVRLHRYAGETTDGLSPLVEVLEAGSLEAELHLAESLADLLAPGQQVDLILSPGDVRTTFQVLATRPAQGPAPAAIERHYPQHASLVAVRLAPLDPAAAESSLRLGAVAYLPRQWVRRWNRLVSGFGG